MLNLHILNIWQKGFCLYLLCCRSPYGWFSHQKLAFTPSILLATETCSAEFAPYQLLRRNLWLLEILFSPWTFKSCMSFHTVESLSLPSIVAGWGNMDSCPWKETGTLGGALLLEKQETPLIMLIACGITRSDWNVSALQWLCSIT